MSNIQDDDEHVKALANKFDNKEFPVAYCRSCKTKGKNSNVHDDDEYCRALAWAIYKGKCPMTVGLYVPWGRCKDVLLENIRYHLCKISDKSENGTDTNKKLTVKELFRLALCLLFYIPVITKKPKIQRNIFIKFSAFHCTGCDRLWAGLVTALCDGIEDEFGLIPISIYRTLYKETEFRKVSDMEKETCPNQNPKSKLKEWVPKKILHIPDLFITIFVFLFLVCALLLKFFLYDNPGAPEHYKTFTDYIFYAAVTIFGSHSLLMSGTVLKVIRNCIVTQKGKLMAKMKRTDMSSQLGFMNDVKKEIEIITSYLQMMEIFQKKKIRVILEITKLDKCTSDRVVEVLQAINVLLSNPEAPFICILAVDPGIIVECVEKSDLLKGMANNGYLFLNRVVTLPFSIPQMNDKTKFWHLNKIIDGKNISDNKNPPTGTPKVTNKNKKFSENEPLSMVKTDTGNQDDEANDLIKKALNFLKSEECRQYITDNVINMRRIVNTIVITIRLMIKDKKYNSPDKVTKWVIMAAQWPCSLSWILQCIEDDQQSTQVKDFQYIEKKLWNIYEMSLDAIHANRESLKQLLELDGDPEIFCELLENTEFTVEDANTLRKYTVNLDHTIQRKIELLQGSFNFLRFKKEKTVNRMALLKMKTDDVCDEMHKLDIEKERLERYKELVEQHNLNGKALLYSDNEEIRKALGMNLGDWVEFRAVFLSLPTPNLLF